MEKLEKLNFLNPVTIKQLTSKWPTPVYVYDESTIIKRAKEALNFPAPYGLTVRFAMKANPNPDILKILDRQGILFDASSGFEASLAIDAGIDPKKIMITTQEFPNNLKYLGDRGAQFNASSLHQLDEYGKLFPNSCVGVRINPGLGTGHSGKTNTAGSAASFGIWFEQIPELLKIAEKYRLTIYRIHTHVGSGGDPKVWTKAAKLSLAQVEKLPDVTHLDLGGGFRVARMNYETTTDLQLVGNVINEEVVQFYKNTGRKLFLEIEPGTYLLANAGSLVTTIQDKCNTGKDGYEFLKLDCGMNDILRPSLYGAQHPMVVVNDRNRLQKYVVVGHCCESGDLLTPNHEDPNVLDERLLIEAEIGDKLVIEGVGAYCAHMSAHGYNSFPTTKEIIFKSNDLFIEA